MVEEFMGNKNENVCCAAPTLIFACSGAADVDENIAAVVQAALLKFGD